MRLSKRNKRKLIGLLLFGFLFYYAFPSRLFDVPYSTLINDEKGELLAAQIAKDGQWRFPQVDGIPYELEQCILHFEDEYFYYHPGVNPVSTFRALFQNIKEGKVVSGGSTLSMQVIRLSRQNKARSYWEKIIEVYQAVRLEFSYSKEEVLRMYVSHAPYGGNIVGAETAAWRYFHRPLHQLSWAEYATLAVLPNSPSLIRPGKNSEELKAKRNRLLQKLKENEVIDASTYELSLLEPLPGKPLDLPNSAFHLLSLANSKGKHGHRISSTINGRLQKRVSQRVNNYVKFLENNEIRNACALVIDVKSGEVKAYVGNANFEGANAQYVDLIQAPRSSGSILKPFLYAAAIEEGMIHNNSLLRDVPISIQGFAPSNFNKSFDGVVPAKDALARSLNIPATNILKDYGVVGFYDALQDLGFSTINRSPDNYGLSLILGGAEVTLWDVAHAYSKQVRTLNNFFSNELFPSSNMSIWKGEELRHPVSSFAEGTWYMVTEALKEVQRPGMEESWRQYSSSRKVAWKTGTSFGYRDAWAVGYDANYLVAVWVGNAEGEGRPGLTGASVAAPLMFDIFQDVDKRAWFEKPLASLRKIELCATSGLAPSPACPKMKTETSMVAKPLGVCTYHHHILINDKGLRVNHNCLFQGNVKDTVWFCLDPVAAFYYKKGHQKYKELPAFDENCSSFNAEDMAIIYPQDDSKLIIPKNFKGEFEKVILEATHRNQKTELFWHLDDEFVGSTQRKHQLKINISPGNHVLMIMDEKGQSSIVNFEAY